MIIIFLGSTDYAIYVFKELVKQFKNYDYYLIVENVSKIKLLEEKVNFIPKNHIKLYDEIIKHKFIEKFKEARPLIALSVNFMRILPESFYSLPLNGTINLHPSFLPFNRGNWPEFWSIINGSKAGVTLHYIDAQIDTGPIIAQKAIKVEKWDTGETLAYKIDILGLKILMKFWPKLLNSELPAIKQKEKYKLNKSEDMYTQLEIIPTKKYKAEYLINLLRASTMPNYIKGSYMIDNESNKKLYFNLKIETEDYEL